MARTQILADTGVLVAALVGLCVCGLIWLFFEARARHAWDPTEAFRAEFREVIAFLRDMEQRESAHPEDLWHYWSKAIELCERYRAHEGLADAAATLREKWDAERPNPTMSHFKRAGWIARKMDKCSLSDL